jgi:hypothetical protein
MKTIVAPVAVIPALIAVVALAADTADDGYFPPPESKGGWRVLNSDQQVRDVGGMDRDKIEDLKQWLLKSDRRDFAAVVIRRARNRGPWQHVMGHDGDPHTANLAFDPCSDCGYSIFALYHASLVCENVTGRPYDQFAIESLFKPIGCEHWWFQQFDGGGESYPKWSKIELEFAGPDSAARGTPSPFALSVDVDFTSPSGNHYRVPGFYDGDGRGGEDGNVWKVRFSADELGRWTYRTTSSESRLHGRSGSFEVTDARGDSKGFWKWGRLEYTGSADNSIRYLKFRDGPYWLKAGCDDPENFLGSYSNFDTPAKRRAAVDYLAGHGINSLYIMTHNIDGDDKDVWPWLGATAREAKANSKGDVRFDVAKLDRWHRLLEYMQTRGVVPYLILEDDSAWKGYDHDRYHREMIARFGYLPALLFNMGEEHNENYSLGDGLAMAGRFKALDPYSHPLGIHNINRAKDDYIDSPDVDFTAIQTGQPGRASAVKFALEHNQIALDWIERCKARSRRVLMVNFDEGRPEHDRRTWWSAYLGGGVWEAHVAGQYDQPHSAWETTWRELGGARRFMESLPFHQMEPRNDLVTSGDAFCLAKPGAAYAVYLPHGGTVSIQLAKDATYGFAWWNPANGWDGQFEADGRVAGGRQSFRTPAAGDWGLRIVALEPN